MKVNLPENESLHRVRLYLLTRDTGETVNIRVRESVPDGSECRAVPETVPSWAKAGPEFWGHGETVEAALQDCVDKVCAVSHDDFQAHVQAVLEEKLDGAETEDARTT